MFRGKSKERERNDKKFRGITLYCERDFKGVQYCCCDF